MSDKKADDVSKRALRNGINALLDLRRRASDQAAGKATGINFQKHPQ